MATGPTGHPHGPHTLPEVILQLTRKGGDPWGWIWNNPLCRSPSSNSSWQSLGSPEGQAERGVGKLRQEGTQETAM